MPKKKSEAEELNDALLSIVTTKRKNESDEEGELSDEHYEESKPLKKRRNTKPDIVSSDSEEEFNDGFDDDLMGDEADRKYLMSLPELQREDIIAERYSKRQTLKNRHEIIKKMSREKQKKSITF